MIICLVRGTIHKRLSLPTFSNRSNPPTDMPTGQPDLDNPSLPSHVILDCVKPTSKTTHKPQILSEAVEMTESHKVLPSSYS